MTTDALQEDPAQRQLRQASAALDRALRAGRAARAEEWLTACPALAADDDLALELIYGEFVTRESLGDAPPPQEYYDRFPARADRLRRLFDVDALLGAESPATNPGVADTRPTTG
ncbi:MAG: hypothetical protein K1X57_17945, partial [Gemmataceae bacterium]|nr:hypothetical protein [Gemmataceae bacterium]